MPVLTELQQECYELYGQGWTMQQIADKHRVHKSTISRNYHRARQIICGHTPHKILMPNETIDQLDLRRLAVL